MEPIKNTISLVLGELQKKSEASLKDNPENLLKKFLSKKEQNHVKILYFKKGVLVLGVDSSTWMYYMNLKKEKLFASMVEESPSLKNIRFKLEADSGKAK
jgi:hypothetical protein